MVSRKELKSADEFDCEGSSGNQCSQVGSVELTSITESFVCYGSE